MKWPHGLLRALRPWVTLAAMVGWVSAFGVDAAWAQELNYPIALQQEWQQEFREFTLDHYQKLMQPALTEQERERLKDVRFEFPVGPHDQNFNFYSSADKRVVMPVASLLFFKDLAFASAWLSVNGYSTMPGLDYVSILSHGGLERWPQEKRFPKDALGIPADAGKNPRVMKRYEDIMAGMVMFVAGHELGHIMYGFEGPNSKDLNRRRQSERDADHFALEIFRRMNWPPIPVSPFFAITSRQVPVAGFAGSEESWRSWVNQRTHPLDGERIQAAAQFITANRLDFEKGYRNPSTAPLLIMNLVNDMNKLAKLVDDRSLSVTQADCTMTYIPEDLLPRKGDVLDVVPRPGERFASGPWSGVYEGTVVGHKLGQSTAIRLILRRDGSRLTGDTQYLCFRGKVEGSVTGNDAVVRWTVGNIRRMLTMHAEAEGATIRGTWRSDTAEGGDGAVTATRVPSP
jgi:hypothetical protein